LASEDKKPWWVLLAATLAVGFPFPRGGGELWVILALTTLTCATVWSALLAAKSRLAAPNQAIGPAATVFFVIGALAAALAAVVIAIGLLIVYFAFKIGFKLLQGGLEQKEAAAAQKEHEQAQEAARLQEAAREKQGCEEEMLVAFGSGMRCVNCGQVVSKEAQLCPECGGDPHVEADLLD
jgi:hypothetical protein